jgi:hypothetical protein
MRRYLAFGCGLLLAGCSDANGGGGGSPDASNDSPANDVSVPDTSTADTRADDGNAGNHDTGVASDTGLAESSTTDAEGGGASDGGCPSSWTVAPAVDVSIEVPDGGGGVLLHAAATGTQNYTCSQVTSDAGTSYAWVFTGPQANLNDCNATLIGHHFASDGGATAPEWQTSDGTYVIGRKKAAFTPDGGAASVPWLLLQGVSQGGSGTLSQAMYIQRINTDGGNAPAASTCSQSSDVGTIQDVPYTADYYFFGP